ncbi:MAG: DUF58 domain-containing protein, partial [Tepidisphaeraceae bacterium]
KAFVPRTGNLNSVHNIMDVLAGFDPVGQTNIGGVLHDLAGQIRRKGLVIVISDLFDDEERVLEGIQHLRFGGNEVIVFQTMDPFELDFPFSGMVEFEGLEVRDKVLTRPKEIRKSYLREVGEFQKRMREGCEKNNVHYVLVNTGHALHEVLNGYLAFRYRTTVR